MEEWRKILGYCLLVWVISGVIISIGTLFVMWKREGFKLRIPAWWEVLEFFGMCGMITILSYAWIGLNIYWHYEHKRILRKIKEGKTSAKDLF